MKTRLWCAVLGVLGAWACQKEAAKVPGTTPKPAAPLAPLNAARPEGLDASVDEREQLHVIVPLKVQGEKIPAQGEKLTLDDGKCTVGGESFTLDAAADVAKLKNKLKPGVQLLTAHGDTYMAQVAPLLALLEEVGAEVWFLHPDEAVAYPVKLRDEKQFGEWIDEPVPGKLRVVQRSDGFELTTNMGKLPGLDPNGPTVPPRGGQMDLSTLQNGFVKIKGRFKDAPDVCFLPSYGTPLNDTIRAFSANFEKGDEAIFKQLCLVFPRPGQVAAKKQP
ncbi:MAG: hypothetical protein K1X64_23625 [Myxococcaceae bacterium]|nr:hypothetical protein [Myxococcaceae bacterium]